MAEIVMPRLSDTMEEGTILRWLRPDGAQISRGEELLEIETDKATMTYESDQEGVLRILAPEGATLPVGEPIAQIGGEEQPRPAQGGSANGGEPAPVGTAEITAPATPAPPAPQPPAPEAGGERLKASPLARRIAGESGIDLHQVSGSGPGGRIVKADVVSAGEGLREQPAQAPAAAAPPPRGDGVATAKGETTEVELSRTQQTIARRMAESKATIPDFTVLMDVDMGACVELRRELKRLGHPDSTAPAAGAREQLKTPTYNDMVVKACALALREYPSANGSYRDGRLQVHSRVNVGVAVAAEKALVVPTVFDADEKSLGEIARETHTLAERVRAGTISPPEVGGGTFTVSNLGMFGVKSFTAIINPPQVAILSVGAVELRPVAREDAVLARHTMTLTLVCDHRVLYGAEAAGFLARIRELLQTPSALTL